MASHEQKGNSHEEAGFDLNMTSGIDSLTQMYPAAKWKHQEALVVAFEPEAGQIKP